MMIVHITDVSTWGLYTKCMICMLQVGVHFAGIIWTFACYGIGTIISDCDCQHGMTYYRIYHSRLGVSDMNRFCWIWFFSFLLSSFQFVSLHECGSRWVWFKNLKFSNCLLGISVWIFDWYTVLETCTGTWIIDWELGLEPKYVSSVDCRLCI